MNDQLERLLAGPLVWLSTLHAAAEVIRTRQERLRGNDPSDLEDPGSARRHIRAALRELEEHALRLSVLQSDAVQIDDDVAHAAASFDSLIITNRCGQLLEDVHGRLMSLYPDVDVHVVEETRVAAKAVDHETR
ncbi:MAG: hypothetical protein ACOCSK_02470, partial [Rhodothermales bacterium]